MLKEMPKETGKNGKLKNSMTNINIPWVLLVKVKKKESLLSMLRPTVMPGETMAKRLHGEFLLKAMTNHYHGIKKQLINFMLRLWLKLVMLIPLASQESQTKKLPMFGEVKAQLLIGNLVILKVGMLLLLRQRVKHQQLLQR